LMQRTLGPRKALDARLVKVEGSPNEFDRCIDLLAWLPAR